MLINSNLIALLAEATGVMAVAVGGSGGRHQNDAWSDEDYFVFASDAQFTEAARDIRSRLQQHTETLFVGSWGFSHRFGLKLTAVDGNHRAYEIFVNCPLTFSPLPMTRDMQFRDEASKIAFEQNFPSYSANLKSSLTYLVESASWEIYDALRGMRKSLKRGNSNGYSFYFRRLKVIISALNLHLDYNVPYDPHMVERKMTKDFGAENISESQSIKTIVELSLRILRRFELDPSGTKCAEDGVRRAIFYLSDVD